MVCSGKCFVGLTSLQYRCYVFVSPVINTIPAQQACTTCCNPAVCTGKYFTTLASLQYMCNAHSTDLTYLQHRRNAPVICIGNCSTDLTSLQHRCNALMVSSGGFCKVSVHASSVPYIRQSCAGEVPLPILSLLLQFTLLDTKRLWSHTFVVVTRLRCRIVR